MSETKMTSEEIETKGSIWGTVITVFLTALVLVIIIGITSNTAYDKSKLVYSKVTVSDKLITARAYDGGAHLSNNERIIVAITEDETKLQINVNDKRFDKYELNDEVYIVLDAKTEVVVNMLDETEFSELANRYDKNDIEEVMNKK